MRDTLAILFMLLFLPAWFAFMFWIVANYPLNVAEALGIGTINGVFLAAFKDMWQFYFRRAPSVKQP